MKINRILLLGFLLAQLSAAADPVLTFCNPLNLDYGPGGGGKGARSGADPVIVPFKNKYYLFDSLYPGRTAGYRVSDDLVHWTPILFDEASRTAILNEKNEAYAPGVVTDGETIYYGRLDGKNILRTRDPDSGVWEIHSREGVTGFDPAYFMENGRLFVISGALESNISELDPKTFKEIPKTRKQLTAKTKTVEILKNSDYGLYQGKSEYESGKTDWNRPDAVDTERLIPTDPAVPPQFNTLSKDSMQEAGWLTKYRGRYYLQNSNPGTACPWYSDSVWVADQVDGPYQMADYATAAMKVGGFINSAGHSCVFQDFKGNWWRVTTMWVGVYAGFERRIGLFPAGFDEKGRMFTQTEFGDYPLVIPAGLKTPSTQSSLTGWSLLSKDKACSASSTLKGKELALAADENIRTWWSAATGNSGEWFQMDLGKAMRIQAVQINFAEQDCDVEAVEDYYAYQLLASTDGKEWKTLADKSTNLLPNTHDYLPLEKAVEGRYLKLINLHAARKGKFALRDLRVFGSGRGELPGKISTLTVERDQKDRRNVTLRWKRPERVEGYVLRYGVAPDALHLSVQYQNPPAEKLTLSCLLKGTNYFYRLDTYNENGVSEGEITRLAQ